MQLTNLTYVIESGKSRCSFEGMLKGVTSRLDALFLLKFLLQLRIFVFS